MTQPEFKTSKDPKGEAAVYIAEVLKEHLSANEKVLFLVPGGSAIVVLADIANELIDTDVNNLTITLTDERYGDVGHEDSNWKQILDSGFKIGGAHMLPVLTGKDRIETVHDFDTTLRQKVAESDYILGLFGIGRDGHTSGILPRSLAVDSTDFACGYQTEEYYRITTTSAFLSELDLAVVYATGASKRETLEQLKGEHSTADQPAQALKQADKFIIFND